MLTHLPPLSSFFPLPFLPTFLQFQAAACFAAFAITDDIDVKLGGSAFNIVLPTGQVALSFFFVGYLCMKRFGGYKAVTTTKFLVKNPKFTQEYDEHLKAAPKMVEHEVTPCPSTGRHPSQLKDKAQQGAQKASKVAQQALVRKGKGKAGEVAKGASARITV